MKALLVMQQVVWGNKLIIILEDKTKNHFDNKTLNSDGGENARC